MAKQQASRRQNEQGMLKNIGGRDKPSSEPPVPSETGPSAAARIGWMEYVGGALWAMVFCGAGFVAWLYFANGG